MKQNDHSTAQHSTAQHSTAQHSTAQHSTAQNNYKTNSIDLFKLFFAFCVVAIHTQLLKDFSESINWYITHLIFRLAVPFFFVASGYFYANKFLPTSEDKTKRMEVCKSFITKLLPPFIVFSAIGLIFYAIPLFLQKDNILIIIIIKLCRTAIFYPRGAMWYIAATMLAVFIFSKFWEKRKLLTLIAIISYFFALLCNSYYFLIADTPIAIVINNYMYIFISARNGIGVGLIFVGIGIWLALNKSKFEKKSTKTIAIMFFFAYFLLILEVIHTFRKPVLDDSSLFISMPLVSVLLFELTKRIIMPYTNATSVLLRKLSIYIYFLHPVFNSIITLFSFDIKHTIIYTIVTLLCLLSWFIFRNNNKPYVKRILP